MRFLFLLLVLLDVNVSVHLTKGSDDFQNLVFFAKNRYFHVWPCRASASGATNLIPKDLEQAAIGDVFWI